MSAPPLPDDTAVDMLTFALSGPGIVALLASTALGAFLLFSFAEIGSNRPRAAKPFFLRLSIPAARNVEFPDGAVRSLRQGESLFRFDSREMCEAVAKPLRQHGASYTVYRMDGLSVRQMSKWPRDFNAPGGSWPTDVIREEDVGLGRAWEEYQRIGETDKLDIQWKQFVEKLGGIVVDNTKGSCRLCGGSGLTRCFRCGGIKPIAGSAFICDCKEGRRPCEWCANPTN